MSKLFSIEFWIAAQLFIDLVIVLFLWRSRQRMKNLELEQHNSIKSGDLQQLTDSIHQEVLERIEIVINEMGKKGAVEMVDRAAQDIIDLLDPLVKASEAAATTFNHQIKEKQRLIKGLNDALDARIVSINILLSRAEMILSTKERSIYQHNATIRGNSSDIRGNAATSHERASSLKDSSTDLRDNSAELRNHSFCNRDYPCEDRTSSEMDIRSDWFSADGSTKDSVSDQQQRIIEWYQQGLDVDMIASRLSMPRGEVQLVVNLKEKFIKMEREP